MPGISVAPQEDPTRPTSPPGCPCPWEKLGMSSLAQHETWKSRRDFHVTSSALAVAFNFMCCNVIQKRNKSIPRGKKKDIKFIEDKISVGLLVHRHHQWFTDRMIPIPGP